jgi:hypothetical protein
LHQQKESPKSPDRNFTNGNMPPQFMQHMTVKAAMAGRTFPRVDGVCAIAASGWFFTEEPHWDLHVKEVIHGYHAQQFEIYF